MNTHDHHHRHNHDHDHGHAFKLGILVNSAFVVVEIICGLLAHSLALLADAGHNLSDVLGLVLAWGATKLAARPATTRFTYGLQSASIMAALANALLLTVAIGAIGWEAIQRFSEPQAPATGFMMIVAAIGVAVNGGTAWLFRDHHRNDLNVHAAFLHMIADAAVSLAVVLSGFVILHTGWLWIDPLASLLICAVIIFGMWRLLADSAALALHAAPRHIDPDAVRTWLSTQAGVAEVHDLHIWAMSTTGVALSAHLLMPGGHPGDAFIHSLTHDLEDRFHIHHSTFQIEIDDGDMVCEMEHRHG